MALLIEPLALAADAWVGLTGHRRANVRRLVLLDEICGYGRSDQVVPFVRSDVARQVATDGVSVVCGKRHTVVRPAVILRDDVRVEVVDEDLGEITRFGHGGRALDGVDARFVPGDPVLRRRKALRIGASNQPRCDGSLVVNGRDRRPHRLHQLRNVASCT